MNVHVYLNPKMKGYQGTRNLMAKCECLTLFLKLEFM